MLYHIFIRNIDLNTHTSFEGLISHNNRFGRITNIAKLVTTLSWRIFCERFINGTSTCTNIFRYIFFTFLWPYTIPIPCAEKSSRHFWSTSRFSLVTSFPSGLLLHESTASLSWRLRSVLNCAILSKSLAFTFSLASSASPYFRCFNLSSISEFVTLGDDTVYVLLYYALIMNPNSINRKIITSEK